MVASSSISGLSDPSNPLLNAQTAAVTTIQPYAAITSPAAFTGVDTNIDWGMAGPPPTDGRIEQRTWVNAIVNEIDGTISSWSLALQPLDANGNNSGQAIPLTDNTKFGATIVGYEATDTGGPIFAIDPSVYPSGNYDLILNASDASQTTTFTRPISLFTNVKLGSLTLPFTDLTFDVPGGHPLALSRTYNSQQTNVEGAFGYGWTLDSSTVTVTSTATSISGGDASAFRPGDVIYITLPGGQQYAFQFFPISESYQPGPFAGVDPYDPSYADSDYSYQLQFLAVDGSNARLEVPGDVYSPEDQAHGSDLYR